MYSYNKNWLSPPPCPNMCFDSLALRLPILCNVFTHVTANKIFRHWFNSSAPTHESPLNYHQILFRFREQLKFNMRPGHSSKRALDEDTCYAPSSIPSWGMQRGRGLSTCSACADCPVKRQYLCHTANQMTYQSLILPNSSIWTCSQQHHREVI